MAADDPIRLAAFEWLRRQQDQYGEVLPRAVLAQGYEFQGHRVPLLGPQGIFKPRIMELPLSITTSVDSPYRDRLGPGGLEYSYRGTDPQHRDNVGLRELMRHRAPLVYFHAVAPGKYVPWWPVFVVHDEPNRLTFTVALDDVQALGPPALDPERSVSEMTAEAAKIRRRYVTVAATRRVHQAKFRERVLAAYRQSCALCRLKHEDLLDAAHIIPDSDPDGDPEVSNGLALCKLHHAAFDRYFLAVRPDYTVEIRADILEETDGPMLRHGLQGMHNLQIVLPRRASDRPQAQLLERRYDAFRAAVRR